MDKEVTHSLRNGREDINKHGTAKRRKGNVIRSGATLLSGSVRILRTGERHTFLLYKIRRSRYVESVKFDNPPILGFTISPTTVITFNFYKIPRCVPGRKLHNVIHCVSLYVRQTDHRCITTCQILLV